MAQFPPGIRIPFLVLGVFFSGQSIAQHSNVHVPSVQDALTRIELARQAGDWNEYHSEFLGLVRRPVTLEQDRMAKARGILMELDALKSSDSGQSEFDYILYCLQQFPLGIAETDFLSGILKKGLTDLSAKPDLEQPIRVYYSLAIPFDYANWRKQIGFYQEAIDTMERVKNRLLHLNPEEIWIPNTRNFLLHCYNILGGIYADLGMFPVAVSYNDLYLAMIRNDPDPWGRVLALGRKGDYLLNMGDTVQSLRILEEAVHICDEEYPKVLKSELENSSTPSNDYIRYTSRLKSAYRDLAKVCIVTGRFIRADQLLTRVESMPLLSREDHIYQVAHRADYFAGMGDLRKAIQVLTPGLNAGLDIGRGNAKQLAVKDDQSLRLVMFVGLKLARLQMDAKEFDRAEQTLDQLEYELRMLRSDLRLDGIRLGIERIRLDLIRHRERPSRIDLDSVFKRVAHTQSLILEYQATTTDDASKLALNRSGRELFGLGLSLASAMPSGLIQDELAIQQAEAGRAVLLDQALRLQQTDRFRGIPDSFRNAIIHMNALIEGYELRQSLGQSLSQHDQSNLTTLREDKRRITLDLKNNFPKSYRQAMVRQLPRVDDIRKQLPIGAGVLSLSLYDTLIFAQLITKTESAFFQIPVSVDFRGQIRAFLHELNASRTENISNPISQSFIHRSRWFYKLLFEPFEELLPERILIVPEGPLAFLPFDALLTDDPGSHLSWARLPYQIKKRALSVHFSVGAWVEEEQKRLPEFKDQWIGFAPDFPVPVASQSDTGMPRDILVKLLYNEKEVQRVGEILEGKAFLGQEASLANFRQIVGQASILHLSTHAKANDLHGDQCFIAFANSHSMAPADPGDTLRSAEIYGLTIPAELLILSACETGIGEVKDGEGMIGLHHAFMHAGVRSILSTLWTVDDRSMADLIVFFASMLSGGLPKDIALQRAKLQFISDHPTQAHPFYWSAPTIQGSLQPLRKKRYGWYFLGGFLVIVVLIFTYRTFWNRGD
ncbi:MAG: CHAT domain-containing protein [Saprospiraceae bacterium]|nr:CHAT domain-containing protein [Saprospiraceae bacterium]